MSLFIYLSIFLKFGCLILVVFFVLRVYICLLQKTFYFFQMFSSRSFEGIQITE